MHLKFITVVLLKPANNLGNDPQGTPYSVPQLHCV